MIPKISEICDCCNGDQSYIKLFDDKCFKIVEEGTTGESFCLKDFAYPLDGHNCASLNLDINGGEISLFDNELIPGSPSVPLEADKQYARGIMLRVFYPKNDTNGEEIPLSDKSVSLYIENSDNIGNSYPLYDVFIMFTNPSSNDSKDLINKIKVNNPNSLFKVRVSALVIFGKA
jgi:hypothetical protein